MNMRSKILRAVGAFLHTGLAIFGGLVLISFSGIYDPSLTASVTLPLIGGAISSRLSAIRN
jgi:hypothetical protein